MNLTLFIFLGVLIVAGGIAGGVMLRQVTAPPPVVVQSSRAVAAFTFTDHNGRVVHAEDYRGRWMLVLFGFTNCPDICPTSLSYAGNLLKAVGPLAEQLQVTFITVDPERDTAPALKEYLSNFDSRIVGLTGTPDQLAAAAKLFGVFYDQRLAGNEGSVGEPGYTMDHSTALYIVGPDGRILRAFALSRGADTMTEEVRAIMTAKEKP